MTVTNTFCDACKTEIVDIFTEVPGNLYITINSLKFVLCPNCGKKAVDFFGFQYDAACLLSISRGEYLTDERKITTRPDAPLVKLG